MMKKIALSLIAVLTATTSVALASLPFGTNSFYSCGRVPYYCGGLIFGLTGLYLRPSLGHVDYALVYPENLDDTPTGVLFEDGKTYNTGMNYDWSFRFHVGYVIPCTPLDFLVSYTHLNLSDRDSVRTTNDFTIFSSFFFNKANNLALRDLPVALSGDVIIPVNLDIPIKEASMKVQSEYKVWDVEVGHEAFIGCRFKLHYSAGVRFTQLDRCLNATYSGFNSGLLPSEPGAELFANGESVFTLQQKSDFQGVGPRFNAKATYELGYCFGLVTELSGAILVGDLDASFHDLLHQLVQVRETIIVPDAIPTFHTGLVDAVFSYRYPGETRVVPNIEGKLGLNYSRKFKFCNPKPSILTFEAGWMATHYYNCFDRLSGAGAPAPALRTRQTLDTTFEGPYLGVQIKV